MAGAADAAGNTGQQTATLVVIDPSVVGDPVVAIASPGDNQVVTAPVDVIGTADDPDLLYYTLSGTRRWTATSPKSRAAPMP